MLFTPPLIRRLMCQAVDSIENLIQCLFKVPGRHNKELEYNTIKGVSYPKNTALLITSCHPLKFGYQLVTKTLVRLLPIHTSHAAWPESAQRPWQVPPVLIRLYYLGNFEFRCWYLDVVISIHSPGRLLIVRHARKNDLKNLTAKDIGQDTSYSVGILHFCLTSVGMKLFKVF